MSLLMVDVFNEKSIRLAVSHIPTLLKLAPIGTQLT